MISKFWVIIPARYASTRFPGKPLANISGKPMIQHVYNNAINSGAYKVIVATDDNRIRKVAEDFGASVCMTSEKHKSGTDRIAEVARQYHLIGNEVIVNVQGDEPLLPAKYIIQTANDLIEHPLADMSTLHTSIKSRDELLNPNVIKSIHNKDGFALYYSRAPIPYIRDKSDLDTENNLATLYFSHIGIYSYRASFLQTCTNLDPCSIEQAESLEQLRVLYNGGKIFSSEVKENYGIGVDTQEDLDKVNKMINTP